MPDDELSDAAVAQQTHEQFPPTLRTDASGALVMPKARRTNDPPSGSPATTNTSSQFALPAPPSPSDNVNQRPADAVYGNANQLPSTGTYGRVPCVLIEPSLSDINVKTTNNNNNNDVNNNEQTSQPSGIYASASSMKLRKLTQSAPTNTTQTTNNDINNNNSNNNDPRRELHRGYTSMGVAPIRSGTVTHASSPLQQQPSTYSVAPPSMRHEPLPVVRHASVVPGLELPSLVHSTQSSHRAVSPRQNVLLLLLLFLKNNFCFCSLDILNHQISGFVSLPIQHYYQRMPVQLSFVLVV